MQQGYEGKIRIEVDGGVGVANIKEVAEAGADMFVAGSAILKVIRILFYMYIIYYSDIIYIYNRLIGYHSPYMFVAGSAILKVTNILIHISNVYP